MDKAAIEHLLADIRHNADAIEKHLEKDVKSIYEQLYGIEPGAAPPPEIHYSIEAPMGLFSATSPSAPDDKSYRRLEKLWPWVANVTIEDGTEVELSFRVTMPPEKARELLRHYQTMRRR